MAHLQMMLPLPIVPTVPGGAGGCALLVLPPAPLTAGGGRRMGPPSA